MRASRKTLGLTVTLSATLALGLLPALPAEGAASSSVGRSAGVPPGTKLTRYTGPSVITKPGTVIDRKEIVGRLVIKAPNVKITKSRIRGTAPKDTVGIVTVKPSAKNFLIQDSELRPLAPSVKLDGLQGSHFTARRVRIIGGVDNIKIFGNNVRVEDSWLSDTNYFRSDPRQGNRPTHNDNIQVLGGSNILIQRNRLIQSPTQNAALQVTQDYAKLSNFRFVNNYVDGGTCSINVNHKGKASALSGVVLSGNRLGRNTKHRECALLTTRQVKVASTDNRFTDGKPIRQRYM